MLCQLPNELVYSVLNDWIENLSCIAFLDSALCNHSERSLFTGLLSKNGHVFDCRTHSALNFYVWISLRLIKLNSLCLNRSFAQNVFGSLVSGICQSLQKTDQLQSIKMVYDENLLLFIGACSTVKSLDLSQSYTLTDDELDGVLEKVRGLLHLALTYCTQLTDRACLSIAKYCPDLETIDLTSCSKILSSDAIVTLTAGCNKLTKILLPSQLVDNKSVFSIAENCPGLTYLYISESDQVSDESLSVLAEKCPLLQTLFVDYCTQLGDASIIKIAVNCPRITHLNIICIDVTDAALFALARHSPLLERLLLIECAEISDDGVIAIAQNCPRLEDFFADDCELLTDLSVFELAKHCPRLKEVGLCKCSLITDYSVSDLIDRCKELRSVGAYGTQQLASSALKALHHAQCVVLSDDEDYQNNIQFATRSQFGPLQDRELRQVTYFTCAAGTLDMPFLRTAAYLCPSLLEITFEMYNLLEDAQVVAVLKSCPLLESVALRGCPELTGRCIEAVTDLCPSLYRLDLDLSCLKVEVEDDEGNVTVSIAQEVLLHNLAYARGFQLRQLRLSCNTLHPASLTHIANYCADLSSLRLDGASLLDDSALGLVLDRLDKLTELSVKDCPLLSAEMVARTKKRFPRCLM